MATASFSYTGGYQYWTVPSGVTSVSVALNGAGSGTRAGGRVTGKLAVTPGQRLCIIVGQSGRGNSGATGGDTSFGAGGAGGNGKSNNGGDGGGGYSAIRFDSSSGTIKCVAGGAGGNSGDGGAGGLGGGSTGGAGGRGTSGSNSTGAATGGTQSQGGNGGTSSSGSCFNGSNASDTVVARGGAGGECDNYSHGGGGGGGGYHSGGGGQASSAGYAPGGGGGGGSNYTGGLSGAASSQGGGGTGNGEVSITYTPPASNNPPTPPTSPYVGGVAWSDQMATKAVSSLTVSAIVNDPDSGDTVRLLVRYSANDFASYADVYSGFVSRGQRATVTVPVSAGYLYKARLMSVDNHGALSNYTSINWWTNRPPNQPTLVHPENNSTWPALSSVVFSWTPSDPDPSDPMDGWNLRYRTAATPTKPAGEWVEIDQWHNTSPTWTINPGVFKGNTFYEWSVRTIDPQRYASDWSDPFSFFISSTSSPPEPTAPINNVSRAADSAITLSWKFVDPDPSDSQHRADIRYRVVGQNDTQWVTFFGSEAPGKPGATPSWVLPPSTLAPGYHYEWQVRTYDSAGGLATPSDWSESETFWTTITPGSGNAPPAVPDPLTAQGTLGCGEYRVFIYQQGGERLIGEITPLSDLQFSRTRDDISTLLLHSNGFGADCCGLYGSLRSWLHEIVVFRNGLRVWEGPITRIAYQANNIEVEAKDVMGYVYRRIMRQGYNDSYQLIESTGSPGSGTNLGSATVVRRAYQIISDALAPWDPNVLPFLTTFDFEDDAKTSRIVEDYSRTAWEEVDDLAATAGLDYTTVGRRIILWDTHRAIGKLPEMGDGDFSDPPIVTEYGMLMCNYQAVTNGSGVWGAAIPKGYTDGSNPDRPLWYEPYGPIELLASSYSDTATGSNDTLTPAALAQLQDVLASQAQRNISNRYPVPVIVRVPDNSTLSPNVQATFDQLVPGVWVPLRSNSTCREVVQWQKLDSVTVTVEPESGESVQVVMSPAPNAGEDPDAAVDENADNQ